MTRESEWDDEQRDKMSAFVAYQAGIGPCGYHHSVTADPENVFAYDTEVCPVCAGADRYARHLAAEDEKEAELKKRALPIAARASDGRRVFARLLSTAEAEARRRAISP